jgi:hypothetical protein
MAAAHAAIGLSPPPIENAKRQVAGIFGKPAVSPTAAPVNGAERLLSEHEANRMLL